MLNDYQLRLRRIARSLGVEPGPQRLMLGHAQAKGDSRWWLRGGESGDGALPTSGATGGSEETLVAVEAWIGPDRMAEDVPGEALLDFDMHAVA